MDTAAGHAILNAAAAAWSPLMGGPLRDGTADGGLKNDGFIAWGLAYPIIEQTIVEPPMSIMESDSFSATVTALPKQLKRLEAESIEIMREVVAEFRKPVMMYSIGKDSSVMLHLAVKAFHPAALPFPLLHVDTTWKFREMIAFRDDTVRRLGLNLLVHVNREGLARGVDPIASGSA